MYLPTQTQPSNARGWVAASAAVQAAGGDAYNVIIDIENPLAEDATDTAIIQMVDQHLRDHHAYSISTVANTIFPEATLRRYGPVDFYDAYHERVFPRMKRMTRDWGRYFDRLTRWTKVHGGEITTINPLCKFRSFRQAISVQTGRRFRWKPTGRFGPKRHPVADGFWSRLWRTAAA
jgi:hypothetical protein